MKKWQRTRQNDKGKNAVICIQSMRCDAMRCITTICDSDRRLYCIVFPWLCHMVWHGMVWNNIAKKADSANSFTWQVSMCTHHTFTFTYIFHANVKLIANKNIHRHAHTLKHKNRFAQSNCTIFVDSMLSHLLLRQQLFVSLSPFFRSLFAMCMNVDTLVSNMYSSTYMQPMVNVTCC